MIAEERAKKRQQFADLLKREAQSHFDGRIYADVTPHHVELLLDDTLDQKATYWIQAGLTWEDWIAFAPYLDDWSRDDLAQAIIEVLVMRRSHGLFRAERAVDGIKKTQSDKPWHESAGLAIPEANCSDSVDILAAMDATADKAERWLVEHPEPPSTKPKSTVPASRRGRGRPRNKEFDAYTSERFAELGNVTQVADEAAKRFGIRPEAARRRIRRSSWYQSVAPAVAPSKYKTASPPQPADGSDRLSITDMIKKHIQSKGPCTPQEFATELGIDLGKVERRCQRGTQFQYLPGNRYGLFE